jgi:lipoic acid synthetase
LVEVAPEVISHNMETVKRLTREVRIQAKYERSLDVLKYLKEADKTVPKQELCSVWAKPKKSFETIQEVRNANVDVITIGQYLQPTKKSPSCKTFCRAGRIEEYRIFAES